MSPSNMTPRLKRWLEKHTNNGRIDYVVSSRPVGLPGPYVFVPVRFGVPGTLLVRIFMLGTDGDSQGVHPMPHLSTDQDWNNNSLNEWCAIDVVRRMELVVGLERRKPVDVSWEHPVRYGWTKRQEGGAK